MNSAATAMIEKIEPWYEDRRSKKGSIDSNVMCAGLYITEFLVSAFPLTHADYKADSQVKGASGAKAKTLLADHGETRQFTSEGGRTSRLTIKHAETLAEIVNGVGEEVGVEGYTPLERKVLAHLLQAWFVARIQDDYFGKQKVSAEIDPSFSVRTTVANLLEAGRERGGNTAGAIAQHLVGAKLQIRFPDVDINVESYTTADVQTGRAGDYEVGDTAIHVTMSPGEKVFKERCANNIKNGFRPRVLVPEGSVLAASQLAFVAGLHKQVAVQSIEDFVGTNIEEVAGFAQTEIKAQLRKLLEVYNERIDVAEADKSLKIEIPTNL
ncbi:hypothetical protein TR51_28640 [Kitasatospora griseola]|uniref:DUF4928 domain-containing protein n=1 Tax=Kitasatospora griseola TaxID=2064 RepID=A0A0D0PUF3_KITGR|nr:hypothetical protein TR51_28640 [Kitasatospora griseola]